MKFNTIGLIGMIIGCLGGLVGMVVAIMASPVFGSIFSVVFIAIFGGVFWSVLFKPMMVNRRLAKVGVPATAKIVELHDTGVTVNNSPQVKLLLEVTSPVGGTYLVETKQIISRLQVSEFQPGSVLGVMIDPNDKNFISLNYTGAAQSSSTQSAMSNPASVLTGPWSGISRAEAERRLAENEKKNNEIFATGTSCRAIVTKYTWLGIYVNGNNPASQLDLEVLPSDGPAFNASVIGVLMETSVPKFQPGEEITVKYDPYDHSRVTIEHS